jgi:hypothetical protein
MPQAGDATCHPTTGDGYVFTQPWARRKRGACDGFIFSAKHMHIAPQVRRYQQVGWHPMSMRPCSI